MDMSRPSFGWIAVGDWHAYVFKYLQHTPCKTTCCRARYGFNELHSGATSWKASWANRFAASNEASHEALFAASIMSNSADLCNYCIPAAPKRRRSSI